MYFHHGIAGTVGDVGGNMNVMQQKKRNCCIAMLCFQMENKDFLVLYLQPFQGSCKKKACVVKALIS